MIICCKGHGLSVGKNQASKGDTTTPVRRKRKVWDPLKILIGRKPWFSESIPPERVDDLGEP